MRMETELLALWDESGSADSATPNHEHAETQSERSRAQRLAVEKTVIFVTHDLEEAIALADEVIVLSAGPSAASSRATR